MGTAIGLVIGYGVCYFAERYQWVKLDQQVYSIAYVPFEPRAFDGIWIAAAAMAVSLIATLYPARSATRIAPSNRYDMNNNASTDRSTYANTGSRKQNHRRIYRTRELGRRASEYRAHAQSGGLVRTGAATGVR